MLRLERAMAGGPRPIHPDQPTLVYCLRDDMSVESRNILCVEGQIRVGSTSQEKRKKNRN